MFDPETEVTEQEFYRIAEAQSLLELAQIIADEPEDADQQDEAAASEAV